MVPGRGQRLAAERGPARRRRTARARANPDPPERASDVRWLSIEPQIGPVDLGQYLRRSPWSDSGGVHQVCGAANWRRDGIGTPLLHWVITGGESGHWARPFRTEWARSLRDQCKAAGVAFFHKQHGANAIEDNATFAAGVAREMIQLGTYKLTLKDKAGKDPAEWHPNLRVQEFPV